MQVDTNVNTTLAQTSKSKFTTGATKCIGDLEQVYTQFCIISSKLENKGKGSTDMDLWFKGKCPYNSGLRPTKEQNILCN